MKTRRVPLLTVAFMLSVTLLLLTQESTSNSWLEAHLPATGGGDQVLWQVQTTFLSVGFAGLAIAAQLFAEAPLAIGASRGRVFEYIGAGWFVGVGLVANSVIAIEAIWLTSALGVLGVFLLWFTPTIALLVVSTVRLMRLFSHPSRLDEVVRLSLVESLSGRLSVVSREYAEARNQLDGLVAVGTSLQSVRASARTLRVRVPLDGRVIRAIKPRIVRRALDSLGPRATEANSTSTEGADTYIPPQILLDVEPGDRTRLGETAFRVMTSNALDSSTAGKLERMLQSAIEFESPGSVTPYEEADREIAHLKDAIGTSIRSGSFATTERALELLGHVVRGVWMSQSENLDSPRRASSTRQDWLFRSFVEVEQDATLSPRAAGVFIDAAMTRALESPRAGLSEYVDESLRSFTRMWFEVLHQGGSEFHRIPPRITTCIRNLAAFSYSATDSHDDHQARATWAMVELVKLSLDAKNLEAAKMAARELNSLFEFTDPGGYRTHVRGGQLILSAWLNYLAEKRNNKALEDAELRELVKPHGTWAELLSARRVTERGAVPFSRWHWWEVDASSSIGIQTLHLSRFIDRAQVSALASTHGILPPADDQETASEYNRFLKLLAEDGPRENGKESDLIEKLTKEISRWDEAEDHRLAREPVSEEKVETLHSAVREALVTNPRLAVHIPRVNTVSDSADSSKPILGMNFRISKHYFVDDIFKQTYANPVDLGQVIARAFTDSEDRKLIAELRSIQEELLEPSVQAIQQQLTALAEDAKHYVLLTPFGGLMDVGWYSSEFQAARTRATQIESAMLDNEVILFDRRTTLVSKLEPETKAGLKQVEGTSIALGVFDDVLDGEEPEVRVETGEHFVVWTGSAPRVFRFGHTPSRDFLHN